MRGVTTMNIPSRYILGSSATIFLRTKSVGDLSGYVIGGLVKSDTPNKIIIA